MPTPLADAVLTHQIDLLRMEADTAAKVLRLLNELQRELAGRIITEDLTAWNKARLTQFLAQTTAIIDDYYAKIAASVGAHGQTAASTAATHAASTLNTVIIDISAALPTETFLSRLAGNALIQGAPSTTWWGKQAADTAFRFAATVRQGAAQGESGEQIVTRIVGSAKKGITGVMDIARSNARSLVHTSLQALANGSRMETWRKNDADIEAVEWLATLDVHTCLICGPRDLKRYTLDDPPQPIDHDLPWNGGPGVIHWGCRCVASPVPKAIPGFKFPVGQRAAGGGPVPGNMDFEAFLKRKGEAWQDESLGKGRAELWRKKKLTLEQLLGNFSHNPLSLTQLEAKYG